MASVASRKTGQMDEVAWKEAMKEHEEADIYASRVPLYYLSRFRRYNQYRASRMTTWHDDTLETVAQEDYKDVVRERKEREDKEQEEVMAFLSTIPDDLSDPLPLGVPPKMRSQVVHFHVTDTRVRACHQLSSTHGDGLGCHSKAQNNQWPGR